MESNSETISKLKLIGKLQNGDKLNTKYVFIQKDGLFTRLSRWIYWQDNRANTINFVRNTIYSTFSMIVTLKKTNKRYDNLILLNIIEDLEQAKGGMINLKNTYADDIKFCCDIETLLESIEVELTKHRPEAEEEVDLTYPDIIQHGVPTSSIGINQNAVNQNAVNGFK
jgi:hypothetical protein